VAFKNPDGSLVVIAFNAGSGSTTFKIRTGGQSVSATLPAGAVATYKWMPGGGTPTPTPTPVPTPTATPVGCGTTNVALNKTATASSIQGAGYPASAAVDGSTTTRWSSLASDPQWLQVDLGSTQSICKVVLNWEAAYGKAFQIQTSSDATNWTSIYSTTTGTGGIQTLNIAGSGRYVRMYGTVRGTGYGYSLWELQVFGSFGTPDSDAHRGTHRDATATPVPTPTPTPGGCGTTNVALNKPATASSIQGAGYPASAAVDGSLTTRWSSAFSDPQWLRVDLGSTQSICRVVLNWKAYGKAFQIQTSTDGTNWTSIYSTTTGTSGIQTLNVTGSGRYIRMYGTVRGTGYGYSLWEFQVFGN
jgi:beta-glucosidase